MRKLLLVIVLLFSTVQCYAADRYWVGGTETWNTTAGSKWAPSSGGTGGETVPTSSDNCFFDDVSGNVVVTTSGTTEDVCLNLTFTGFTGTFSHAASTTVVIHGNLTMAAGMTYTRGSATTSDFSFASTSSGKTVTTASKELGDVIFDGVGGVWTLQDALTNAATSTVTLTNGTLDTNQIDGHSWGILSSSNSNTRVLTITNSDITITGGGGGNHVNIGTATNLTVNASGSNITMNSSSATVFNYAASAGGAATFGTLTLSGTGATTITTDSDLTLANLQVTVSKTVTFSQNETVTFTALSPGGLGNGTNVVTFASSGANAFTISQASDTVRFDHCRISSMTASGGATFNAYCSQNISNNTGLTWFSCMEAATLEAGTLD